MINNVKKFLKKYILVNKDKINKLYHTLIIGLESKESKDDNFHKFLIEINLKAHCYQNFNQSFDVFS